MLGLMQDWPLLCHRIIDARTAIYHPERKIVSRSVEGPIHTTNYREVRRRALRIAKRLEKDGIQLGDRVGTLAWNTWRHLEAWYGIMGIGAIYHTVNPRLFPEQIAWIVNHAEDRMMMTDLTFVPLVEKLADKLPTIERLHRAHRRAHMPRRRCERRRLRGLDRRGRRRLRLEVVRREHRRRHVLHVRHDRRSQGRRLFAPLQRAALADDRHAPTPWAFPRATSCCRSCRCSTPTLGPRASRRR
jgi:acyl-CoA synthetase (AMP-forming)/AMP-acid ligase II